MATTSLPQAAVPTTTREERGVELWRNRGEEFELIACGTYSVPSCSGEHRYLVDVKGETCSCEDSIRRGSGCKHLIAAFVADAAFVSCDGCGQRFDHRKLVEVTEEQADWSFSVFEGERVCVGCARNAGIY